MKEINIVLPSRAFVTTGYFGSDLASSLSTVTKEGVITEYDPESHYVRWEYEGVEQPQVNINCVQFLLGPPRKSVLSLLQQMENELETKENTKK